MTIFSKILKKPKLVKHNREIIPKDKDAYGSLADHDLIATCILAYDTGKIPDANGKIVSVNQEWMEHTKDRTNLYLKNHVDHAMAETKSWLKNYEEAEIIPLSFDHESSAKHNSGFNHGLIWSEKYKGLHTLLVNVIIKDNEVKSKINQGLIRSTSLGTRGDGSIREISFVQNPAIPHGGLIMSENQNNNNINLSEQELELQEQISELEFQETQLSEFTIPNHIIFLRMLKNGKIRPTAYNEFITKHPEDNIFMEKMSPVQDLGIIYGSSLQPTMVLDEHKEKVIEYAEQFLGWRNRKKKNSKTEEIKEDTQLQYREPDIALHYKNILKEIKDLNKVCPQLVDDVIATELGENVNQNLPNDNELNEYLAQLEEIKTKKQNLTIQLQEQKSCQIGKQS